MNRAIFSIPSGLEFEDVLSDATVVLWRIPTTAGYDSPSPSPTPMLLVCMSFGNCYSGDQFFVLHSVRCGSTHPHNKCVMCAIFNAI